MITNPLQHLERHRQMIGMLYKYGTSDLIRKSGLSEKFLSNTADQKELSPEEMSHDWYSGDDDAQAAATDNATSPQNLASDLEAMGPTFIKLGQLLSTRSDFLPPEYLQALARLQDDADPIPSPDIFRTIEEELHQQPEHLFKSFDVEPLATASLGQVHRATMKNGRIVVVKVQRPGVRKVLEDDTAAMLELATLCETFQFGRDYQLKHMVESLEYSLGQEISYLNESRNAKMLAENLAGFERILVPQPVEELTTDRVITMQFVDCEKITELAPGRLSKKEGRELAEVLFNSFLHQVLIHGAFHADPHPGNVALTKDNRIVLMDHGLVVRVPPKLKKQLIKLLLAICEADGDRAAEIAIASGIANEDFDQDLFRREISRVIAANVNQSVKQMEAGAALMQLQRAAGVHGLQLPREVILLGRSLMHLERVVSALDDSFDPNRAIREQSMAIMQKYSGEQLTLATLYQTVMESTEFAQRLPARANRLAEMITNNEIEVRVNAVDEAKLLRGLNKVANRITAGLIVAAMIVGASLMMNLKTPWMIWGYPAVAFLFFMLAAVAGSVLVWKAIVSDRNG